MNNSVNILRSILMSLAVCLPTLLLIGQEIRTSAPDEVLDQELFQIKYQIISADPIREMPKLVATKDFELTSEPQLARTYPSPFWGEKYYTLTIACTFRSKKTGKLPLPQIELVADGQKMRSKKGDILVRNFPEMGDVRCFVEATASKSQVSVGDTLTLSYKLYSTKEVANILSVNIPGLRNFEYQDLSPRRIGFVEERINGVDYKVYEIRKYIIRPRSLGQKALGEGTIEIEYTYPTGRTRADARGRVYEEQLRETKSCAIENLTIQVHDMTAI